MAQLNTRVVMRNDSVSGWTAVKDSASHKLLKGELAIEFDPTAGQNESGQPNYKVRMKIGDGISTWAQLPYFGEGSNNVHHEVSALSELEGLEHAVGDTAVVKTLISNDKYSYTGYVWNGTAWAAMDGNYNASNVYFANDMMVTKEIGYITLTNGAGTIPSAGKNLTEVFEAMFVKEMIPDNNTYPSVTLTASNNKAYEVGSKVTPSYSVTFNKGAYEYGPDTGIVLDPQENGTATGWEITATGYSTPKETASGSYDEITVADNTNFKITAKAYHTAGVTPKNNKGQDSAVPSAQQTYFNKGSKSATSAAITGFRKFFYGPISKDVSELTSADIRGLTDGGKYKAQTITIKADGATGLKAFVIAIPNGTTSSIKAVKSKAGMEVAMPTDSYALVDTQVDVADARGGVVTKNEAGAYTSNNNPMKYKLYAWKPDAIGSDTLHEITLG